MDVRFDGGPSADVETVAVDGPVTTLHPAGALCYTGATLDPNHDLFVWRPEYAAGSSSN
jgi:hypothetical protein